MLYESKYYGTVGLGDSIMHYGVKGQKWGLRRWQNTDMSLTPAGRIHYGVGQGRKSLKYRTDVHKLTSLKRKADVEYQKLKSQQYENRANTATKVMKVAAPIAVASTLGIRGTNLLARNLINKKSAAVDALDKESSNLRQSAWEEMVKIADRPNWKSVPGKTEAFDKFEAKWHADSAAMDAKWDATFAKFNRKRNALLALEKARLVTQVLSIGTTAGAAGVYVYSKHQKRLANKRITDLGHKEAVSKLNKQIATMKKEYGSKYVSELLKSIDIKTENKKNKIQTKLDKKKRS